jgi:hypothetical protein
MPRASGTEWLTVPPRDRVIKSTDKCIAIGTRPSTHVGTANTGRSRCAPVRTIVGGSFRAACSRRSWLRVDQYDVVVHDDIGYATPTRSRLR